MRALVVEGQAGAAKTPLCHLLVDLLDDAVYVHVFHEVSQALGHDVYELWAHEPTRALDLLTEALRAPRATDLVVFDRGWLTVCRGLEGAGRPDLLPRAEALMAWTAFVDQDESWVRQNSRRLAQQGLPPWDLTEDFTARRAWSHRCAWRGHLNGRADLPATADRIAAAWRSSPSEPVTGGLEPPPGSARRSQP